MRDIADRLREWVAADHPFALARVLSTWGSAPRRPGSAMAVTADQRVAGSVSGGCIEAEVIDAATSVLESGAPRVLEFGVADETAWSVGLSCGGRVRVLVERFPSFETETEAAGVGDKVLSALLESVPAVWMTALPPSPPGHLLTDAEGRVMASSPGVHPSLASHAAPAYDERQTGEREIEGQGPFFVHVMPPPPRLLVIGATDIAVHLVGLARALAFETVVIDPREVFASPDRFAVHPDELIADWPQVALSGQRLDDETFAVLLTHDPKIDDPALHTLLRSRVQYIGALGSSRTHAKRCSRLSKAGFPDSAIKRIHGPVGLDISATSPSEIALSIVAEVIAVRNRSAAN